MSDNYYNLTLIRAGDFLRNPKLALVYNESFNKNNEANTRLDNIHYNELFRELRDEMIKLYKGTPIY